MTSWHEDGFEVARAAYDPVLASHGALVVLSAILAAPVGSWRVDREGTGQLDEVTGDGGGAYHHWALPGPVARGLLPDVAAAYADAFRRTVREVTGTPVIVSPYLQSDVTVKVYGPGDEQGWHYDTNVVTALLALTSTPSPTRIIDLNGAEHELHLHPGDLLVMQGRDCYHRVDPVPSGAAARITVPLNYYVPGDTARPPGMDDLVYGS